LPRQVIQGGSELPENFSSEHTDTERDIALYLHSIDISSFLRVELGYDFVRFTLQKNGNLLVQRLEMLNGPEDLRAYVTQFAGK
jgi:hypothetical protein